MLPNVHQSEFGLMISPLSWKQLFEKEKQSAYKRVIFIKNIPAFFDLAHKTIAQDKIKRIYENSSNPSINNSLSNIPKSNQFSNSFQLKFSVQNNYSTSQCSSEKFKKIAMTNMGKYNDSEVSESESSVLNKSILFHDDLNLKINSKICVQTKVKTRKKPSRNIFKLKNYNIKFST